MKRTILSWVIAILAIPIVSVVLVGLVILIGLTVPWFISAYKWIGNIPWWVGWGITLVGLVVLIKVSGIPDEVLKFFDRRKKKGVSEKK
jgi:hypothetical protein